MKSSFAFMGPDRIVGIDISSPAKSPILRFPSGERLQQVHLANGIRLRSATHGDYLFVGPLTKDPLGLFDVKNGTLPINFKTAAADIYDGTFVTERLSGQLALNILGQTDTVATIKLPQARLGPLRAAAVSSRSGVQRRASGAECSAGKTLRKGGRASRAERANVTASDECFLKVN